MQIQSINNNNNLTFQSGHHPRRFGAMMNYIYKNLNKHCTDTFETLDSIPVVTEVNGKDISGVVDFVDGKFSGLRMDEGFEHLKKKFMDTALKKYIDRISSSKTKARLNREKKTK